MELRYKLLSFSFFALMLTLFATEGFAQSEDDISAGATRYGKALEKGDWEKIISYTYPPVIEENGGEAAMLSQAAAFEQNMSQRGFTLKKAELAEPLEILPSGKYLMCVVPMRLTFEGPLGKLYSESGLLAVSSDEGKNWHFIDLAQVKVEQLAELFPEINPELVIPAKKIYQE